MPAEVSSVPSLSQRFTLDYPSFEKLLAAAWVLQCVHDQLHCRQGDPDETIAKPVIVQPVIVQEDVETIPQALQVATSPRPPLVPASTPLHDELDTPSCRLLQDETLAELVEAQQAIETGTLDLDAAMKLVVGLALRFTEAEGSAIWLFAQGDFVYRAGAGVASNNEKLRLAVLSSLAGAWPSKGKEVHGVNQALASCQQCPAELEAGASALLVAPIYHGREAAGALSVFADSAGSFSDHDRNTLRLMSGLLSHGLRKAAEELRVVAPDAVKPEVIESNAHLGPVVAVQASQPSKPELKRPADVIRTARTPSFFSFRTTFKRVQEVFNVLRPTFHIHFALRALRSVAIAPPVWLLVIVAALLLLETWRHEPFHSAQATSTQDLSGDVSKSIENTALQRTIPLLEVSHMHTTDPATSTVVQELSRYEIRGLRRQAQFGDDSAAFTLGMVFETGHYVRQSCAEAARWVAMAAEAGNAAAQYNLGLRYRDGDGVPTDRAESEKWLRKASGARNSQAQLALKVLASR